MASTGSLPVSNDAVHLEGLREGLAHRHTWVERAVRVLEDERHAAADGTQHGLCHTGEVLALEKHLA